jgi:hypothetical protein
MGLLGTVSEQDEVKFNRTGAPSSLDEDMMRSKTPNRDGPNILVGVFTQRDD